MNVLIGNYVKSLSIEDTILIAKQFEINFTYEEMAQVLPYLKENYLQLFDEQKSFYLIRQLGNITGEQTAAKTGSLIQKLLVILSTFS